jgi:hypothetical protein
MSFLKECGKDLGVMAGTVMGKSIKKFGDVVDIEFIQGVGEGIDKSMQQQGELIGNLADGIADIGVGIAKKDNTKTRAGFDTLGSTLHDFSAKAVRSTETVAKHSLNTVEHLVTGNFNQAKHSATDLAKTVVVSVLAVDVVGTAISDTSTFDVTNSHVTGGGY